MISLSLNLSRGYVNEYSTANSIGGEIDHINHFFASALKNLNQPISPNPNLAVVSESRAMVYEFLAVRDAEIACGLGEWDAMILLVVVGADRKDADD